MVKMERDYGSISHEFKKKYCASYDGNNLQGDITQPYWKSMNLEKKRLNKLGVVKKIQIHENGMRSINDTVIDRKIESVSNTNSKTTMINTPVSVRSSYYIHGKLKTKNTDYYSCSQCMVLENDEEITEFICPNCGALGTKESFIDGCDYCETKFQVGQFDMKVSSYNIFHDYELEANERKKQNKLVMLVPMMIAVFMLIISMSSFFATDKLAIDVMCQQIASVLFMVVMGVFVVLLIANLKRKKDDLQRIINTESLNRLENDVPEMNREDFVATLDYKIKTIHFAESNNDVCLFLNEKYNDVINQYASVIECTIKNCKIDEYHTDMDYRYITVKANLHLVCIEKGKVITREEPVTINLYKNKRPVQSKSLVSYTCEKCGSSINLLNGGICEHCNSRIDFSKYDWAISEYKSGWNTDPKSRRANADKWMKKAITYVTIIILLLNSFKLSSAVYMGFKGITKDNYSVYSYQNEIIPSFTHYGYAILGDKAIITLNGSEYTYKYVADYKGAMKKYANRLVNEDHFKIVSESDNKIILKREKRFGIGKVKVTITKDNGSYKIKIGGHY